MIFSSCFECFMNLFNLHGKNNEVTENIVIFYSNFGNLYSCFVYKDIRFIEFIPFLETLSFLWLSLLILIRIMN